MAARAYAIGELARLTGTKVPTIRHYETVGVLAPPERSVGGQRRYDAAALDRLRFIRRGRALGLGLSDIRRLLDITEQPHGPCAEADAIARRHLEQVEAQIAQLETLRGQLQSMLANGAHEEARSCAVLESLSEHETGLSKRLKN